MKEALSLTGILLVPLLVAIAWDRGYASEIWAAWSALSTYGAPVIALACGVWWLVMRSRLTKEHQAIASRESAADLQEEKARNAMSESERIRKTARDQEQATREEAARFRREAAAQIENANARRQRSVNTNIGRQRTIQKLRGRVVELEEKLESLRKRIQELGGGE